MRLSTVSVLSVATLLAVSACGSDDASSSSDPTSAVAQPEISDDPAEPTDEPVADEPVADAAVNEPVADAPAGGGNATLELSTGETYEFSVLCSLEPQVAAGSEILFTATSYDDPGLDITQFGDDGAVTGIASVTVFDGSYETLWDAGSVYDAFGGGLELSLSGSTINGSGSFFPSGDVTQDPVDGTVTANC